MVSFYVTETLQSYNLHTIVVRTLSPNEVNSLTIRLASQLTTRVHHIFTLTYNCDETPIMIVLDNGRSDLASTQVDG